MRTMVIQLACFLLLVTSLSAKHLRLLEHKEVASDTIDVLILLDTSSSIDEKQFSSLLTGAESWFSQDIPVDAYFSFRWSLATFSDKARVVQPLTSSRNDMVAALASVKQEGGGTNYEDAFSVASSILQTDNHKAVVLYSDGIVDEDPDTKSESYFAALKIRLQSLVGSRNYGSPVNASNQLKKQGIKLFTVGLGTKANQAGLTSLSTFNCSYSLASDADGSQIGLQLSNIRAALLALVAPPTPVFRVNSIQFSKNVSVGENIPLLVSITNLGKYVDKNQVSLVFERNAYSEQSSVVLESFPTAETRSFEVVLSVPSWRSLREVEEVVNFKFVNTADSQTLYCRTFGFKFLSENFIQSLLNYVPEDRELPAVNIMAFGFKGAGKSSFINTVYSSISDQIQWYLPSGGKTDGTRTKELIRSPLWNSHHLPHIRVNFWDTWGTEDGHYTPELFGRILSGELPDGFKLSAWDSQRFQDNFTADAVKKQREIHAVLFVVPPSIRQMPDAVRAILNNWDAALDRGLTPILIITHADKILESDHARFQKAVAGQFLIPVDRVRLISNYVAEQEKSFSKDMHTLEIFSLALKSASTYLSSKMERLAICDPPCLHGVCTENKCNCGTTGYRGSACSIAICDPACTNDGLCVAPGTCDCSNTNGYFGPRCMLDTKLVVEFLVGIIAGMIATAVLFRLFKAKASQAPKAPGTSQSQSQPQYRPVAQVQVVDELGEDEEEEDGDVDDETETGEYEIDGESQEGDQRDQVEEEPSAPTDSEFDLIVEKPATDLEVPLLAEPLVGKPAEYSFPLQDLKIAAAEVRRKSTPSHEEIMNDFLELKGSEHDKRVHSD